jgi:uncharacterized protein (TIGR03000 family)
MYTMVMMSALSMGPDVPQFNGYFRDLFSFRGSCNGCYGSCTGRTSGGYAASCQGCSGCDGFGSRIRSFFSFGGCHGSCQGNRSSSASNNCHGGGCYGSTARISTGCTGCYGSSCFGSPQSCLGGGMIYDGGMMPGMGAPIYPGPTYPSGPMVDPVDPRAPIRPAIPEIDESRNSKIPLISVQGDANRATVTVRAPVDARVYAEGQLLRMTAGERSFVTPALPSGQSFDYTFRVEYTRDGERLSREKKVAVRAGGQSICDFTDTQSGKLPAPPSPMPNEKDKADLAGKMIPSAEPISAKIPKLFPISATVPAKTNPPTTLPIVQANQPGRAKFSVKLPANAVLYIDGRKDTKTGEIREFVTPVLPADKEFKYELKVEIPGPHGYPQSATTTVSFRAGETVPVLDFVELMKK